MHQAEPLTITRHVDLDIDVDQLWDALSDPASLATWLGDDVDLDVRPGATGTVVDDGIVRHVRVDQVHAGRELTFTWWQHGQPDAASTVRFAVERLPDGASRLAIVETFEGHAQLGSTVRAQMSGAGDRWGVRIMCLWACTFTAVALVR